MNLLEFVNKYGNQNIEEAELKKLLGIKENITWKPKYGENYYFTCSYGDIMYDTWDNTYNSEGRYALGNYFKTREEAEFALERLKTIAAMERYAKEHNECEIDWLQYKEPTTYQSKFYIAYDYEYGKINYCSNLEVKHNDIYFTSKEIAMNCVKEIGEERIKKYYLCVEE